ncbi:SWIM zinc finger family protein [Saliphagus infecundisoli]|uniref:SWIM zinc finger domain-containing protein n=1 Tax=Saliphagus infecundisoli TaxID=1849069 RepID=A0ABD5QKB5_9EURY|nr:SWIM zinc finger family protein [Saliphagus infecundisoli]
MDYPTREEIRSLCTEQSFERGVNYYHQERVQELDIDGGEVRATVRGSNYYEVAVDIADDTVRTRCSCPYDYAGDCKHIVAVLLAVEDRDTDTDSATDASPDSALSETVDIEAVVEDMAADELRSFLLEIIEDDRDIRDRLVAFAGEDTGKTVYDYKQEIGQLFDSAAGRGGLIDYDTHIDFSQYYDLAETHRERGNVETATDIYRAITEAIRENLNRIDDSGGYHGREIERAIDSYVETVAENLDSHEQKRPYIEYLCEGFVEADHGFASDYYDDALRTLCTTTDDLEYWLDALDERVSNISLDAVAGGELTSAGAGGRQDASASDDPVEVSADEQSMEEPTEHHRERTDDVLYTSDFTDGPLTPDDFTGGTLDIQHLAVGTLKLEYFVGDAFERLRIDDPTTDETHTADVDPTESTAGETEISSSLRVRSLISTYIYILRELGEEAALPSLYEEVYLESTRFCKQYAERLIEEGNEDRAIEVLEDGIETFRSTTDLRWLAADLYRERDTEAYRRTLKQLFLDHTEWAAYDDMKDICDDQEWQSLYEEFERQFADNRQKLIAMYVHEADLENGFAELKDSENLSLVRQYRDPVATFAPAEYFEFYRELVVPFAAGETGRRHYRTVADHLEEMQQLVPEERFDEFLDFLKDKHSNRPAFLDELEKAGF